MKVEAVKSSYGAHPWYAVPEGSVRHPTLAVWLDSGQRTVDTMFGTMTTDGGVRFFTLKRELVTALTANGHELVDQRHK